jgi:hypothetical protein
MTAGCRGRNRERDLWLNWRLDPRTRDVMIDRELLEILACPNCKTKVELVKDGTALKCPQCRRVYPIKDDIPVMLIDEATIEP